MAYGDGAGFGFFCADDEHVGNFLELGVADFGRELFVAVVEMDANVVALQSFGGVLGVVGDFFADGADLDLDRSEPEREGAGVMLDQNAEEAFDGAEQGTMDHEGLMLGAVFGDVFEAETRGQVEIELDGGELPRTADGVDELDVDFGAVKGGFASDRFIGNVELLLGFGERGGGTLPVFGFAGVILRMCSIPIRKLDFEFVKTEIFHYGESKIDAGFHFAFDLRWCAENVRVVLRETADTQETVQDAAALVAIDSAEFGETHGKIAVTVEL